MHISDVDWPMTIQFIVFAKINCDNFEWCGKYWEPKVHRFSDFNNNRWSKHHTNKTNTISSNAPMLRKRERKQQQQPIVQLISICYFVIEISCDFWLFTNITHSSINCHLPNKRQTPLINLLHSIEVLLSANI